MLKAWQPVPTLTKTIIMFFLLSLIFLGLGIPMQILSTKIIEYKFKYSNKCSVPDNACAIELSIPSTIEGPVFVYYELHNFYQNHRLYAKSVSDEQLKGKSISSETAQTDCDPIVYNANLSVTTSFKSHTPLVPDEIAYPCGMVAYSLFNDSFTLEYPNGSDVTILNSGIAWPSDKKKYKYEASDEPKMWTDITDERFMNWMRIAAMSTFRKLWGRVEANLISGNYTLVVNSRIFFLTLEYDISQFGGEKFFVLSQSNFFGSKN